MFLIYTRCIIVLLQLTIAAAAAAATTTTTTFFQDNLVSWHQKDKPFWILLEQEMMGWHWQQLDHHLHLAPDR